MWIVLVYNLAGEPIDADRYYSTRDICMTQAQWVIKKFKDVSRVRCIDPNDPWPKVRDPALTISK